MDIDGLRQRWVKDHWWFFVHRAKSTPKQNQIATTGTWTTDLSLSGWVCYHYTTVAADSLQEQECSKLEHGMINSTLIQKVRSLHTCPECESLWFKLWQSVLFYLFIYLFSGVLLAPWSKKKTPVVFDPSLSDPISEIIVSHILRFLVWYFKFSLPWISTRALK